MARLHDIIGAGITGDGGLHGTGTVGCRDAGGDTFAGLNGDGEFGAKTAAIALHHQGQIQQLTSFAGHGHTDQTTAILGHKVNGFGSHILRRHHQVTFVLPVLIVHQDNHLPLTDIFDQFFNTIELHNITRCWR